MAMRCPFVECMSFVLEECVYFLYMNVVLSCQRSLSFSAIYSQQVMFALPSLLRCTLIIRFRSGRYEACLFVCLVQFSVRFVLSSLIFNLDQKGQWVQQMQRPDFCYVVSGVMARGEGKENTKIILG